MTREDQRNQAQVRSIVDWILIAVLGIAGGALVFWMTPNGLMSSSDSITFFSVANHINRGLGITSSFAEPNSHLSVAGQIARNGQIPLVNWQPGYPVLLGMAKFLCVPLAQSTRIIAILGAAVTAISVSWIGLRVLQFPRVMALVVAGLAVLSPVVPDFSSSLVGGQLIANTESLFNPLGVACFAIGIAAIVKRSTRLFVLACVLVAALTLTRGTGFTFGVALAVGLLVSSGNPEPWNRRRRMTFAAFFACVGPLSLLIWNQLNRIIWHASASQQTLQYTRPQHVLRQFVMTTSGWFAISQRNSFDIRFGVVALFVVLPIAVAVVPQTRRWLWGRFVHHDVVAVTCAVAVCAHILAVCANWAFLDRTADLSSRHLSPIQPFQYLLIALVIYSLAERAVHLLPEPQRRRYATVPVVIGCVAIWVATVSSLSFERRMLINFQDASQAIPIRVPKQKVQFVSDNWGSVAASLPVSAISLPRQVFVTNGRLNPDFASGISTIVSLAHKEDVLVVILYPPGTGFSLTAALNQLKVQGPFVLVAQCTKGSGALVYALKGSHASTIGRSVCA